jgi:hypothetical protein
LHLARTSAVPRAQPEEPSMYRAYTCRFLLTALISGLVAITAGAAAAEQEGDCPTWFPDFRCERSGRWDGFHKPIVMPFLFEDPFINTEVSAHFIYHEFPRQSIFGDGHLYTLAVQARVAITDRLAFIATKDGIAWNRPETDLGGVNILPNTTGFWNISGGFKYALFQDKDERYIVTPSIRFEVPTGSHDTFQGRGYGLFIPGISGAWGYDKFSFIGDMGAQIAMGDRQSDSLFWQFYGAYNLAKRFIPFVQLSGIVWLDGGDGEFQVRLKGGGRVDIDTAQALTGTGDFEGADVANIGTKSVAGKTLWTAAVGAHIPLTNHLTFSAAYERPISTHRGIFKNRMTSNLTLEF